MIHQSRLCWEGARVFARAAESDDCGGWLADQLGRLFGPAYRQALAESRVRVLTSSRSDALAVEAGTWRVRLEELLHSVPEAEVALRTLVDDVAARLAAVAA